MTPRDGMNWSRALKVAWAAPCSAVGLVVAVVPLLLGGRAKLRQGVLEVTYRPRVEHCGRVASRIPYRGIVFGHTILAFTQEELDCIGAHERVHVEQYERWGLLFFPAYALSSLWQLLNGRSPYWHNHFEAEARLLSSRRSPGGA